MLARTSTTKTSTTNTTSTSPPPPTTPPPTSTSNLDCLVEACVTAPRSPTPPSKIPITITKTLKSTHHSRSRRRQTPPAFTKTKSSLVISQTKPTSSGGYYTCDYKGCGRTFSKKWNLGAHLRLHTGERPFVCGECGRSFMWKSSMKSHENVHRKAVMRLSAGTGIVSPRQRVLLATVMRLRNEKKRWGDSKGTEIVGKDVMSCGDNQEKKVQICDDKVQT